MSLRTDVQQEFARFAAAVPKNGRVVVVGHSDVDGLTAATIITRVFEHLGCSVWPYVTRKGENAWSATVLERVAAQQPDALVVVDLGSRVRMRCHRTFLRCSSIITSRQACRKAPP
jgi:single-stranded DNA-specific DHH superfamily exonuclease